MKYSISIREANKLLRQPNPKRSFGDGSTERFAKCSSSLLHTFSRLIEAYMEKPPNSGEGCRVQVEHIEKTFAIAQNSLEHLIILKESMGNE